MTANNKNSKSERSARKIGTSLRSIGFVGLALAVLAIPVGGYALYVVNQLKAVEAQNLRTLAQAAGMLEALVGNFRSNVENLSKKPSYACGLQARQLSRHLPISDPDACNERRRVYAGPVIAIVDANTFSCGDLFAAGIADHGIGQIVSVGEATGAGGANVWTSDDIQYAYHAAALELPPIPRGISFSISVRRIVRTGRSSGLAVKDVGVAGDDRYEMTCNDLLSSNIDLAEFCTGLLTAT